MKHPHYLVTGGAGFLGRHLTPALLATGARVTVLDSEITGHRGNLAAVADHPHFRFIAHDIREPFSPAADADFEAIYHLACPASPQQYLAHPILTWETSVLGTREVLKLAQRCGAKVLFSSTSEIYGDPLVHPQGESYWGNVNPVGPRSCYDEGKRAAETLCYEYARLGVDVRLVRIFNTYGPHMNPKDGRVVTQFITQALAGQPLSVYGDGSQTRCLCYVSDMIAGLQAVMNLPLFTFTPINLGSETEISILELAHLILKLTGSSSPIHTHALPQDDPQQRKPDVTLAQHMLHWSPLLSLEQGLQETISSLRSRFDLPL